MKQRLVYVLLDSSVVIGATVPLLANAGQSLTLATTLQPKLTAFQLFMGKRQPMITKEAFNYVRAGRYVVVHGNMGINLAGQVEGKKHPKFESMEQYALLSAVSDIRRCNILGTGVIFHTGSCKDREFGHDRLVKNVKRLKKLCTSSHIVLENSAGEGNKLCSTLPELAYVVDQLKGVTVCIDTCHLFAAGQYDFTQTSEVNKFFDQATEMFGQRLEVIHLNDSKFEKGCRKDRHAPLLHGHAFTKESLTLFLKRAKKLSLPLIFEVPETGFLVESAKELKTVSRLIDLVQ